MKWSDKMHVCTWFDGTTYSSEFNLMDSTGNHSFESEVFVRLAGETQTELLKLRNETEKEAHHLFTLKKASEAAIEENIRDLDPQPTRPSWIITIGLGGVTNYAAETCAGTPFFFFDTSCKTLGISGSVLNLFDLVDGGFVIDKRCVLKKNPHLAFAAPLLDTYAVENDSMKGQDTSFLDILAEPQHFGAIAAGMKTAMQSDSVAFDKFTWQNYIRWWRNHGAKIGKRVKNEIVWETNDAGSDTKAG